MRLPSTVLPSVTQGPRTSAHYDTWHFLTYNYNMAAPVIAPVTLQLSFDPDKAPNTAYKVENKNLHYATPVGSDTETLRFSLLLSISAHSTPAYSSNQKIGGWENDRWKWQLNWRRVRYDWESSMEENMLSSLYTGSIRKDSHDHLVWRKDPTGIFSVRSAYSVLANHQATGENEGVFSTLWQAKASPKALITAWRVLHDRIPTRFNLSRRGVHLISSLCPVCNLAVESFKSS